MPEFNPEAFGARLREHISGRIDVKALQQALRSTLGENAPGTSYGSIWSYVNGKAPLEPRREVVDGLARVLGVSADELLWGRSQDTPAPRGEWAEQERWRDEVWKVVEPVVLQRLQTTRFKLPAWGYLAEGVIEKNITQKTIEFLEAQLPPERCRGSIRKKDRDLALLLCSRVTDFFLAPSLLLPDEGEHMGHDLLIMYDLLMQTIVSQVLARAKSRKAPTHG